MKALLRYLLPVALLLASPAVAAPGDVGTMVPSAKNVVHPPSTARGYFGSLPTLNAKTDYGAKGDNTTNDGPSLASALAACGPTAPLYLPPGTYKTQQKLYQPPQCKVFGDLNFTYLTSDTPSVQIFADNTAANFTASAFTGVISGTTLTASAVTGQLAIGDRLSGSGISNGTRIVALGTGTGGSGTYTVNNSQSISSEAMTSVGAVLTMGEASNLQGIGVHGDNIAGHADALGLSGSWIQLANILAFSGGTYSVNCPSGAPGYQGVQIRNSLVGYSKGDGYFDGCADSNAYGTFFYANAGNGADAYGDKTTWIGSTFEQNTGYGISLYNSQRWVLVGNHIVDNYGPGISLNGFSAIFDSLVLTGNDFSDNGRAQASQQDCHIFVSGPLGDVNMSGNTYQTGTGGPSSATVPNYVFCDSTSSGPAFNKSTISDAFSQQAIGIYEDGTVQAAVQSAIIASRPNILLNGAMDLDQPNEGAAVTLPDTGTVENGPDGWEANNTSTAVTGMTTLQRVSSTAPGAIYAARYTIGTGGSIAPSDEGELYQVVSGDDLQNMKWGSASASPAYVSGSLNCSVTGSFAIALQDDGVSGFTVSFVHMVAVPAANVEVPFSFPVAGPTSGSFTGAPEAVVIGLITYAGSNNQGTVVDAWQAGTKVSTAAQTQLSATTGAHCQITNMKLEKGSVATPFVHEETSALLARAQLRYWKTFPPGTKPAQSAGLAGAKCVIAPVAASVVSTNFRPPSPMFIAPTVTTYNPSAANANWRDVTGSADISATVDPSTAIGPTGVEVTSASVATQGHNLCIHAVLDGSLQ